MAQIIKQSHMEEKQDYSLRCSCIRLLDLEKRQDGLINGNFTFHAKQSKVKVKDLREAYKKYKLTHPNKVEGN